MFISFTEKKMEMMYKLFVINLMSEHENKNVDMPSAEVAFEGLRPGMFAEVSGQLVWPAHQPGRQVPHISTNNIMIIFKGHKSFILYFLRKNVKLLWYSRILNFRIKTIYFLWKCF